MLRYAPAAAGRAASLGAHREAAAHYARALRFGARPVPSERADLLKLRSRECYLTDDIDEAISAEEQELELRRELGQRLQEGASRSTGAQRSSGVPVALPSPPRQQGRRSSSSRRSLPGLSSHGRTPGSAWPGRPERSELARELGDAELTVGALSALGYQDFTVGRCWFEQALALARENGLVARIGRVLIDLSAGAMGARDYAVASEYIDQAIDYCSDRGLELYRAYGLAYRARLELDQGRWDKAAETAAAVLRIRRASILPRIWGLVVLGLVRARRGDPGHHDLLAEAWSLAEPTVELFRMGPVVAARAETAWLQGNQDGVAIATDTPLRLAVEQADPNATGQLAVWRRRAGVHDEPLATAEPYASELAGNWRDAANIWAEAGCPYEAALALASADEEEPLREALEQLQRLEARPAAAIVSRRLRELGVRGVVRGPRSSTRSNSAQLTARELEVLRLLADGLRNATIAERLFLSPRTVENHVSAILRKLNAQSRGEAVAEAHGLALLQEG